MSKETELPSGRVVIDERGNSVWEWRNPDGTYSRTTDTQRLRTLEIENYEIDETRKQKQPDFTSYFGLDTGKTTPDLKADAPKSQRRSLDDMRRLSEEIKRKREQGLIQPAVSLPASNGKPDPDDKKR